MYNKELTLEILHQISEAIEKIIFRFESIQKASDFTSSQNGMEKLDSICMQLIAIGESLKNIDKITNSTLLNNYPEIDWKGIKGLRDIISHHYFDIDADEIFWVCKNQIPLLSKTIKKIISDLEQ
jgi:uncharacterized protein with HEPN domain